MADPHSALYAAFSMTLSLFDNDHLAALNIAVQTHDRVPEQNMSYELAIKKKLIEPSGRAFDLDALRAACANEVARRIEAGTMVS